MNFPFLSEALKNLFSKSSCDMYPAAPAPAAPRYRGRIVYHPEKCMNCGMCERVCAGGAISHSSMKFPETGDELVTRTFDLGSCTFCSHCADFCSSKAIELSGDYHMIATKHEDLLVTGTLIKSNQRKAAAKAAAATAASESKAPSVKPRDDGKPVNDPSKCVYCGLCAKKCPGGALTVDRASKTWTLDEDKCLTCGTCAESCPKGCIIM